jgi:hypothetical protein
MAILDVVSGWWKKMIAEVHSKATRSTVPRTIARAVLDAGESNHDHLIVIAFVF